MPPPNPVLKTQKRDTFRVRNFFAGGLLPAAQLSSAGGHPSRTQQPEAQHPKIFSYPQARRPITPSNDVLISAPSVLPSPHWPGSPVH